MNSPAVVALPCACMLGEGLFWEHSSATLWFVDIHGCRLLRWKPDQSEWAEWKSPERLGWALPDMESDEVLVGMQTGIALVRPAGAVLVPDWVARPFLDKPSIRLNDAKADSSGAVWTGSMNNVDESSPEGGLYRLSPDGVLTLIDAGYTVPNGPAIAPDERRMLHADSGRRIVYAFELDVKSGRLSNKRIWKRFEDADGYPDGMCFDAEGCVWIAHWGVGRVSRFDPSGALMHCVQLPAPLTTNVCFAGANLDRVFVTSARVGIDAAALAAHPLSGHLFEIDGGGTIGLESVGSRISRLF